MGYPAASAAQLAGVTGRRHKNAKGRNDREKAEDPTENRAPDIRGAASGIGSRAAGSTAVTGVPPEPAPQAAGGAGLYDFRGAGLCLRRVHLDEARHHQLQGGVDIPDPVPAGGGADPLLAVERRVSIQASGLEKAAAAAGACL